MKIADKIKQIRKESGKSQQEMSDILGLPRYIIANWEQGRSAPALEDIAKISECFNCSTDYLLGREDYTSDKAFFPEYTKTGGIMKLKEIREEKGFSQKELAKKIGVSPTNIYNYEVGRTEPSLDMLKILSNALDVSIDYLVGRTDDETFIIKQNAQALAPLGDTLTQDEKDLLKFYRGIGEEDKRSVLRVARSLFNEEKERRAGKIAN